MVRLAPLPPRTISAGSTSEALSDVADTVRLAAGVSVSPTVKAIAGVDVSMAITRPGMEEIVGATLTWLTVTVKVRETTLLLVPPSLTVTVMVAEPEAAATGVNLIEPLAPGLV